MSLDREQRWQGSLSLHNLCLCRIWASLWLDDFTHLSQPIRLSGWGLMDPVELRVAIWLAPGVMEGQFNWWQAFGDSCVVDFILQAKRGNHADRCSVRLFISWNQPHLLELWGNKLKKTLEENMGLCCVQDFKNPVSLRLILCPALDIHK